jgi:hypothetical protein
METGLLIPASDPGLLAAAFGMMETDTFRQGLGQKGRERARSHFTVARMFEETDRVYATCLMVRT